MNDYDPIQKASDATKFAESRFGKHYLARLQSVREGHYRAARTLQRDGAKDTLLAAAIARADEIDGELAYFAQAREIVTQPKLRERILKNLKRKSADD